MFKHFTFALCAGALFTGCVLSTGDTDTDNNDTTNTPNDTTAGDTTVVGTTADEPTSSTTTAETNGTTFDDLTTSGTTADEPTTSVTSTTTATEGTTDATTDATTENTTGTVLYGNCGWYQDVESYYACEQDGGVPGAIDPMGEAPILCNPGLVAGEACSDDGPVDNLGCCTEEGVLYYCGQSSKIIEQDCG